MKSEMQTRSIAELLDLRRNGMLAVNPEYQRGAVWNASQQKKLIDSVLRGYPLPIIFLHHKKKIVAGMQREDLEIIDGQQRLNALQLFREGGLNLFDPIEDDKIARFPLFIKNQTCPWSRKNFDSLPQDLQNQFLNTTISVALIETNVDDEARDLFIRLQAGLPLNAQEKRDAWPGGYPEFVLKLAGKANNEKYPGHNFFKDVVKKIGVDRGQVRQLCAQIGMLYFEKATQNNWKDIGTAAIDDYYYKNLSFDNAAPEVAEFRKVLDKAYSIIGNRGIKRLQGHEAIHVILMISDLFDDYSPAWETKFLGAFEQFRKKCAIAKASRDGGYWTKYVQWTMTSSDSKSSLLIRHKFFIAQIYDEIRPLMLDQKRMYGPLEREIVYYRDNKCCAVCDNEIPWDQLEIHHVTEHQFGGRSIIENGVPVHKVCHPKGKDAIEFEKKFFDQLAESSLTKSEG
jgi:hypothetical protein